MWEFSAYRATNGTDIDGSIFYYVVDGVHLARKVIPIWNDPKDRTVHNGITYILKPPTWETAMDKWFAEQKELEKTFDSPHDYANYLNTVLALSE